MNWCFLKKLKRAVGQQKPCFKKVGTAPAGNYFFKVNIIERLERGVRYVQS